MLEAFGRVLERRKDLPHLLLVSGVGGHKDRFAARAEQAGALDSVRFLPYLSQEDLIALYTGAELCVYPSLVEGWGIPVTEPLALGTPIVTSNTSGLQESVWVGKQRPQPRDQELQGARPTHRPFGIGPSG